MNPMAEVFDLVTRARATGLKGPYLVTTPPEWMREAVAALGRLAMFTPPVSARPVLGVDGVEFRVCEDATELEISSLRGEQPPPEAGA